jgi:hypothetical protein
MLRAQAIRGSAFDLHGGQSSLTEAGGEASAVIIVVDKAEKAPIEN